MTSPIQSTRGGNVLRGYRFGFGAGKQRSKYTKNQHSGSLAKISIAAEKNVEMAPSYGCE